MRKRKERYLIIFAFLFMWATKAFGNLYVSAFGVVFALSVGLACLTEIILRRRDRDTRE
ncbi:TPA: hypothetical protein ACR3Z0_000072 [Bacillus thuringiensis]|uniref:hypothetical protein n=1 Tax=Bacillus cereus group TaxID=86661 RepID=UPI0003ADF36C|nr:MULTISPECIES: hypothetical protein [Bacillus cereus group]ETE93223.1 hypothetical protein C621_0209630 [Bacillus thuringiensis serovar aizawai str. Leapi01]ETE95844.1 hypothetical protein C623_0221150 [Bacillus thuringiensis serovar aizawai str. Hu4-2]KLA09851.1 hypothetical protein B4158_5234 [Bacillus cereus]MCC3872868.1 hypothetical protein [Bacillus thuringiensis]MCC3879265.1 hypothetical protein [Bacillus thuringiensis]